MIDEFFREGLLKKEAPSKEKALKSIEKAQEYLEFARKNLEMELFEATITLAYSAMFHAARAIAFSDGVVERSHFALIQYLIEKHGKSISQGMLNKLDFYRKIRHSLSYGLDSKASDEEAENAVEFAEEFLQEMEEYLEAKK